MHHASRHYDNMKLRSYLFLLVAVALLPALIFSVFMLTAQQKQEFATLERGMRDTARALAAALDREFEASIQALKILAESDHLDKGQLSEFYGEMKRSLAAYGPAWQNITLSDRTGQQLINLRLPFGSPLPQRAPELTERKLRTGEAFVSDLFPGPVTGAPSMVVTVPVLKDGEVKYLLRAGFAAARLSQLLMQQKLPPGWIATIIDRNKIIVARTQGLEKLLGTPATPTPAAETSKAEEGWYQGVTRDNVTVYTAFSRSRWSGWAVALGVPTQQFDAPARRSLLITAATGALLLLLGGLFAAIIARRITLSATALSSATKALGKGETLQIGALRVAELDEVAREIETAAVKRKRAEEALEQSELRYRRLHESMTDAFALVDMAGRILECNRTFQDMLGYTEAELRQLTYLDVTPEKWHAFEARIVQEQIRPQGFSGVYEKEYRRKDGTVFPVELRVSLIRDDAGQPAAMSAIVRDITERKRAEERMRELTAELEDRVKARTADLNQRVAEIEVLNRGMMNLLEDVKTAQRRAEMAGQQLSVLNKELESFSHSVSHDLKAPLRSISGFAEIIARHHAPSLNEEGRHYVDNIVEASAHMERLIDDLLAYSRLGRQALRRKPVPLKELVNGIWRDLQADVAKAGARLNFADGLPVVSGDPTMLRQLFANLIDNALAYSRPGVPPEITLSSAAEENGCVTIRVSDNGVGIPEEHRDKIFNLFQRLDGGDEYPGTGIGLAIVKKAAELHGGSVSVESVVGKGTTFSVTLAT
jgi:PAS domain S-box-containing protein